MISRPRVPPLPQIKTLALRTNETGQTERLNHNLFLTAADIDDLDDQNDPKTPELKPVVLKKQLTVKSSQTFSRRQTHDYGV